MEQLSKRNSVQTLIAAVQKKTAAEGLEIGAVFENCITSILDTTIQVKPDDTTFVITGDIPAMWLRDSACQVRPYLYLAKEDAALADMIEGVIRRQVASILIDPYANAFNEEANGNCWEHDLTDMKPELWERKFEIDSLCFPIQLSYLFWKNSGRTSQFTEDYWKAAKEIVTVFRTEQKHETDSPYTFQRPNCSFTDTLSRNGKGALVNPEAGLIWSGFRPSDDACVYGYLIPSNMFAAVILEYLSEIAECVYRDLEFAAETKAFATQLRDTIEKLAVIPGGDKVIPFYAYEVDGYGQYLIMDDANVPSLLSIPYLGYCKADNEIYQNTKKMMLSDMNPYYYEGACAKGIGSMHTPPRFLWHIALGMQGLVSDSREEKRQILQDMVHMDGGTSCMHEGIDVDDPTNYTRPWFGWANAVFVELVLDYCGYQLER